MTSRGGPRGPPGARRGQMRLPVCGASRGSFLPPLPAGGRTGGRSTGEALPRWPGPEGLRRKERGWGGLLAGRKASFRLRGLEVTPASFGFPSPPVCVGAAEPPVPGRSPLPAVGFMARVDHSLPAPVTWLWGVQADVSCLPGLLASWPGSGASSASLALFLWEFCGTGGLPELCVME